MRRLALITIAAVLLIGLAAPAYAGGRHHRHHNDRHHNGSNAAVNVALGLASFAVLNQVMGGFGNHNGYRYHRTVVYDPFYAAPAPVFYQPAPVIYYAQPPVVYQPQVVVAAPAPVIYPHGRYEFSGQQWVWISNAPAPAPLAAEPCQYTGRYVKTPHGFQPECH